MWGESGFTDAGGLISYGIDERQHVRDVVRYIDISKHVGRVKPPLVATSAGTTVNAELSLMRSVRSTECKLSESDGGS
jgi:hypothetical protein